MLTNCTTRGITGINMHDEELCSKSHLGRSCHAIQLQVEIIGGFLCIHSEKGEVKVQRRTKCDSVHEILFLTMSTFNHSIGISRKVRGYI